MKKRILKNRVKRILALALSTAMLSTLSLQTAFAASYIGSVSVTLDLDLVAGEGLPSLTTGYTGETGPEVKIPNNSRYEIEKVEWSKDVDEMEMGKTYNLKVTLDAQGDYEFKNTYSSSKVNVKGGTFVSARQGESSDELIVTLKTRKVEGVLDIPSDVDWQSTNSKNNKFGYATWDKVEDAAYDVDLYRDGKVVQRVDSIKKTSYNFYPYMTKEGDYSFRVRAVPSSTSMEDYATKSDWAYSDEFYLDEDDVSDGTGQGQEETADNTPNISNPEQVGWIASSGRWFFRYPDGTYLRDSWGKIGGVWYLFDSNGEMLTGWHNRNGHYYYMNGSGAMHTGWLLDQNVWYYLNPDGSMQTGWLTVGNQTYYMDESGAMVTGWKEVGGQFYYFYPDGHKAVNEVISGFYVDYNGIWHRP